jgi:multidrug resistance efflux pump
MTRSRTAVVAALAAVLVVAAWWTLRAAPIPGPTAPVTRGEFADAIELRGELKAARSVTISAPADAGELRILRVAPNGQPISKGALVVEFDASTVERTVREKQSELKGLDAEIAKISAESHGKEEAAVNAESVAGFDVGRAELDYSGRELLPRVDAEQKRLKVLDAQHKQREAQATVVSTRAGTRADLAAARQKREKALRELARAERQLAALTLAAPNDGIVNLLPNWRSGFDRNQPFKEGDRAWAGASIAELPDPASLFAFARADEIERGRLDVGQSVTVRLQALPDRTLRAHVESIGALARTDFTSWPPPKTFELSIALDQLDARLRPGMTAAIRIVVKTMPGVLLVPATAVFNRDGEEVAWVAARRGPEMRRLRVRARNSEVVAVDDGLAEGERVLLVDPTPAGGAK